MQVIYFHNAHARLMNLELSGAKKNIILVFWTIKIFLLNIFFVIKLTWE